MSALRERGYYDLVPPADTQKLAERLKLNAMSLEYEPSLARGSLETDYLVIGWLKWPEGTPGSPLARGREAP